MFQYNSVWVRNQRSFNFTNEQYFYFPMRMFYVFKTTIKLQIPSYLEIRHAILLRLLHKGKQLQWIF